MELVNSTRMIAAFTVALDPDGREHLVVVIKGTFRMPDENGAPVGLADEQVPLVTSDVFFGAPGLSAPLYESDFALRKSRCDILLNASAWAPGGRPARRVRVEARIGDWSKSFAAVGDRTWEAGAAGIAATPPAPFVNVPLSYDRAFGGTDHNHPDPAQHSAFAPNPSGRGFHKALARELVDGTPLPNTEEEGIPVSWPAGSYRPMSFGALGRHWDPRVKYAGTYDQKWLDNVFPFLPSDFDARYYQAAPIDQQLPIFAGEQTVTLTNLTEDGYRAFLLPHFDAPVHVFPARGGREDLKAQLDTILIEPDLGQVTMTWRVARPVRKSIFEIAQVMVGRRGHAWWQLRERASYPIPLALVRRNGPAAPSAATAEP